MIRQHYTGSSRRAVNVIWNASGRYDFDPPFLAFFPNGDADDYFNLVIGLAAKWLDLDRLNAFFDGLGLSNTAQEASAVLWLGIESCVYQKEFPDRPILAQLRKERAEAFYVYTAGLSRQQMMLQSMKVFDQEQARWADVLGKKAVLSPAAVSLSKELMFPGDLDTDGVIREMTRICEERFRLRGGYGAELPYRKIAVRGLADAFARRFMKRELRSTDLLILRKGSGNGDRKDSIQLGHRIGQAHTSGSSEKDQSYIRDCFGPCLYSDREMRILENALCTGTDAACRLWIADGSGSRHGGAAAEVPDTDHSVMDASSAQSQERLLQQEQENQRLRNVRFYQDHIFRIQENIRDLTAQTDTIFASYMNDLPKRSRRGRIDAEKAWRLPVLSDPDVFWSDSDITEFSVTVDLLLDASQSRMNNQEMIASQAYIIAKSFESCGIPVRVSAFRSLRGYTVLQRLKPYKDKKCEGIFQYYAGGWNRDGLCLKMMDYLMKDEQDTMASQRILLVLTDASPNDSMQVPPDEKHLFAREYEGDLAVQDAADAVRQMQRDGIRTAAIFFGASAHLDNVHRIYGQNYTRIRSLSQFSDAVGALLKRALEDRGTA